MGSLIRGTPRAVSLTVIPSVTLSAAFQWPGGHLDKAGGHSDKAGGQLFFKLLPKGRTIGGVSEFVVPL